MRNLFVLFLFLSVSLSTAFAAADVLVDDFEGAAKNWAQVDRGWITLEVVDNPHKVGINTSNKVMKAVKGAGRATYTGMILRGQPSLPFGTDVDQYRYAHVKVLKTSPGAMVFKLENGGDNGSTSSLAVPYTPNGEWQEVVFDLKGAAGMSYRDFFIMVDQSNNTQDVTVYIDDIVFKEDPNPSKPGGEGTYQLIWSDEFDGNQLKDGSNGTLNYWDYQMGRGENGNWGWGNNEAQYYTNQSTNNSKNIIVKDGFLTIRAIRESYQGAQFTSARLNSRGRFVTKYGKIEARIRFEGCSVEGTWPAFWMMPEKSVYGGWPHSGEIDIMEAKGRLPRQYGGAIHYGNSYPNNQYMTSGNYAFPNNGTIADFQVYAVEWEEGFIRWTCNDVVVGTRAGGWHTGDERNDPFPAPFDQDFHIILNLAIGGTFDGNRMPPTEWIQGDMIVDYVRVYKKMPKGIEDVKVNGKEFSVSCFGGVLSVKGEIPANMALYNLSGQKVLEVRNAADANVSDLINGVYILRVQTNTGTVESHKLIINN